MNELLVSIITPCYNSEKTIEKTLECIENQTYKDIEYIIMDGGSTDRTLEIINKHRDRLPENLQIISEVDKGIYDAMNKGIHLAHGKLIGIVNSDDWYENNTVELAVTHYSGEKCEVIYGMQRTYLDGKEKSIFIYHHDFLPVQMITHPTCFVTKTTYDEYGLFDLSYCSAADYDFMLRLWESREVCFTPVNYIMSNFQLGGMSSSQVGVQENLKIRYRRGFIKKKRYIFLLIKSKIVQILQK